ncbi:MAG: tryptophan-rich sensory protein [Rhizobiaceae bacterium]|nr:tryptophan-rich sensory protein [Rhizobiaceae bacterium]
MAVTEKHSVLSPWVAVTVSVVPVLAAVLLGQAATLPHLATWYASLTKPSFNPPDWVFGPAWTLLYALMALASWRILRTPSGGDRRLPMTLFFAQLLLNILWSWCFFAFENPLLGLFNIVPQWLLIVATIDRFRRIDLTASLALLPLALWVGFAAVLNFEIWRLNT